MKTIYFPIRIHNRIDHFIIGAIFLIFGFVFTSCTPTYSKNKLSDSIKHIIKKEYNIEQSEVHQIGKTLYLEVNLPELITTKSEIPTSVLKKINGAVLSISRVCLSSDAEIEFLVVTACAPEWKFRFTIVQRFEDIKKFLYLQISKKDYEERVVLETETFPFEELTQKEVTMREFIARLIVSQVNMTNRLNPFLSTILDNPQLKMDKMDNENLIIKFNSQLIGKVNLLWEEIISQQAQKILTKYDIWHPNKIILIDRNNETLPITITK